MAEYLSQAVELAMTAGRRGHHSQQMCPSRWQVAWSVPGLLVRRGMALADWALSKTPPASYTGSQGPMSDRERMVRSRHSAFFVCGSCRMRNERVCVGVPLPDCLRRAALTRPHDIFLHEQP